MNERDAPSCFGRLKKFWSGTFQSSTGWKAQAAATHSGLTLSLPLVLLYPTLPQRFLDITSHLALCSFLSKINIFNHFSCGCKNSNARCQKWPIKQSADFPLQACGFFLRLPEPNLNPSVGSISETQIKSDFKCKCPSNPKLLFSKNVSQKETKKQANLDGVSFCISKIGGWNLRAVRAQHLRHNGWHVPQRKNKLRETRSGRQPDSCVLRTWCQLLGTQCTVTLDAPRGKQLLGLEHYNTDAWPSLDRRGTDLTKCHFIPRLVRSQ